MGVRECHRIGSRECRRAKSCTNGGFLPNAGTSITPAVVGSDSPDRLEGGARRTQLSDDDRATSRALDRDASRLSVPLSIPRRGLTRNFQPGLKGQNTASFIQYVHALAAAVLVGSSCYPSWWPYSRDESGTRAFGNVVRKLFPSTMG
jgi:hypothetical protein